MDGRSGDVNLCLKHFLPVDAARTLARKAPLIWDVSDDHFQNDAQVWGMPLSVFYAAMPTIATHVTCSTPLLAERIMQFTGVAATVISDPVEFIQHPPRIYGGRRLLWYGHQSNLPALAELKLPRGYEIRVLTDYRGPDVRKRWDIVPWSREQMALSYQWCDAVIIPVHETGRGPRKDCKSPNRLTEAVNAGRFVVANDVPSYHGYHMWLGDIREGLQWLQTHPMQALEQLIEAQKVVQELHHPSVIAGEWKSLFDSVLDKSPGGVSHDVMLSSV